MHGKKRNISTPDDGVAMPFFQDTNANGDILGAVNVLRPLRFGTPITTTTHESAVHVDDTLEHPSIHLAGMASQAPDLQDGADGRDKIRETSDASRPFDMSNNGSLTDERNPKGVKEPSMAGLVGDSSEVVNRKAVIMNDEFAEECERHSVNVKQEKENKLHEQDEIVSIDDSVSSATDSSQWDSTSATSATHVEVEAPRRPKAKGRMSSTIRKIQEAIEEEQLRNLRGKNGRNSIDLAKDASDSRSGAPSVDLLVKALSNARRQRSKSRTKYGRVICDQMQRPYRRWLGVSTCIASDARFILDKRIKQPQQVSPAKKRKSGREGVVQSADESLEGKSPSGGNGNGGSKISTQLVKTGEVCSKNDAAESTSTTTESMDTTLWGKLECQVEKGILSKNSKLSSCRKRHDWNQTKRIRFKNTPPGLSGSSSKDGPSQRGAVMKSAKDDGTTPTQHTNTIDKKKENSKHVKTSPSPSAAAVPNAVVCNIIDTPVLQSVTDNHNTQSCATTKSILDKLEFQLENGVVTKDSTLSSSTKQHHNNQTKQDNDIGLKSSLRETSKSSLCSGLSSSEASQSTTSDVTSKQRKHKKKKPKLPSSTAVSTDLVVLQDNKTTKKNANLKPISNSQTACTSPPPPPPLLGAEDPPCEGEPVVLRDDGGLAGQQSAPDTYLSGKPPTPPPKYTSIARRPRATTTKTGDKASLCRELKNLDPEFLPKRKSAIRVCVSKLLSSRPKAEYFNVQAIKDSDGKLPGQLPFQKGQIIKQLDTGLPAPDGIYYGYYRVGRLRRKVHGIYLGSCVTHLFEDSHSHCSSSSSSSSDNNEEEEQANTASGEKAGKNKNKKRKT